jgi:hypothetical protein
VKELGGQELLDRAFTTDPPRSSEQILHPDKWAVKEKRDDPVTVSLPNLGAVLPGWTRAAEGQLGEMGIAVLLRDNAGGRERAQAAAAGWDGDQFAVYTHGGRLDRPGRRLLVWMTAWDSEADAAELRQALARLGAGWEVWPTETSTRMLVVRGELDEAERTRVRSALAAAVTGATPPAAAR